MLQKNKIRIMTRLAIYDKKFGIVDKKTGDFFKWDYIYFKNFWTRVGVFFGCLILGFLYLLKKFFIQQTDFTTIDFKSEIIKIGFFTVVTLAVYTVIGTLVAQNEYKNSRIRLDDYFKLLNVLDRIPNKPRVSVASDYASVARVSSAGKAVKQRKYQENPNVRRVQDRAEETFDDDGGEEVYDNNNYDDGIELNTKSIDLLMKLKGVKEDGPIDDYKSEDNNYL